MTHAVRTRAAVDGSSDQSRIGRDRSLDGLRGVAAFVMLFGHAMQAFPTMNTLNHHTTGWAWWLTNTPLRIVTAGQEAVLVFFVLSGFVLLPRSGRQLPGWISYYGSRMLRLYLPVIGSLVVAVIIGLSASGALGHITAHSFVHDAALVRGVDFLNAPLWSLEWEVKFSLLLPMYVVFARCWRRMLAVKVVALLALVAAGVQTGHASLTFLPVFAIGMLLAVERDAVGASVGRFASSAPRGFWAGFVVVLALTIDATWLMGARGAPSHLTVSIMTALEVVGAGLTMIGALYWPVARSWLERPIGQWLGTRSFSLYLTHWPLVTIIVTKLGTGLDWLSVVIGIPAALLLAEVFYRLVERPSHRLSRRVGTRLSARRIT